MHNPDSMSLCGLFFFIPLIYDCLYSVSLKTLFFNPFTSFYNYFFSLPSLHIFVQHCDPFRGLFYLNLLFYDQERFFFNAKWVWLELRLLCLLTLPSPTWWRYVRLCKLCLQPHFQTHSSLCCH